MSIEIESRPFLGGDGLWPHEHFMHLLRDRAAAMSGARVCELGGGAQPGLDLAFMNEHDLDCLVVDISQTELDKAPSGYEKLVADVSSPSFQTGSYDGSYDLVFSRTVAEHVSDPAAFHRNARRLLRPEGIAMHFFPTLWWPPFVLNRMLPEDLSERLLLHFAPYREKSGTGGKFPAFYRWCRGPVPSQLARLASAGFTAERCTAYFGEPTHAPGPLGPIEQGWTRLMMRHPNYLFTTYSSYTLRAG
jgi:SAM-dependent methyltransferase